MKGFLGAVVCALALAVSPAVALADVGQARTAGGGPGQKYDRNPSVVRDAAATYLFFARSQPQCDRLAPIPTPGCPDNISYDLYYKKSLDGGKTYGPATLAAQNTFGPTFYGRTISATATADGVHVFWSDGGTLGPVYHVFKATGTDTFSTPQQVPGTLSNVFNAWAVSSGGSIYLYTEEYDPLQSITARRYTPTGTTLTQTGGPTQVPNSNDASIPKAIVDDGGVFRLTMVKPTEGADYVSSSTDGLTFTPPTLAAPPVGLGVVNWDPNLVQDAGGVYFLYFAPDHGNGTQRIGVTSSNDFVHWTATREVTPGRKDRRRYWDYWPEPVLRGGQVVLYYTSERGFVDGSTRYPTGQGHIWTTPGFGGLDDLGPAG